MVNRDNLDRLEEIFREKFQEPPYDIPQEWNEPSDAVWENIEKELDQSKKKRFFYWYALLGAGIMLVTGSYFVHQNLQSGKANAIADTTEKVALQNDSTDEAIVKPNRTRTENENKLSQSLSKNSTTEVNSNAQDIHSNSAFSNQPISTSSIINSNKVQSIDQIQESSNRFESLEFWSTSIATHARNNAKKRPSRLQQRKPSSAIHLTDENKNLTTSIEKRFSKKVDGIAFQPEYNTNLKQALTLNKIEQKKQEKTRRKINIGVLAGGYNPNQIISSSTSSFTYGKNQGKQIGGFARLNLSERLSIEGGLNLSQMEFSGLAKAQTKLEFKEMSEGYDQITFQSKHNLATPLGKLPVDYIVKRNNNYFVRQVAEDPVAQIKIEQEIKQITMPLSVQYAVLNTNTFQLKANAGLTTRYTAYQKSNAELISTELKQGAETSAEIFYKNSDAEIKKVNLNPQLGIEFSKRFKNSDIQLSIEPFMSISNQKNAPIPATPGANSYGLNLKISK